MRLPTITASLETVRGVPHWLIQGWSPCGVSLGSAWYPQDMTRSASDEACRFADAFGFEDYAYKLRE